MLNFLKPGNNSLETILKGVKMMGFDPIKQLEKQLPNWVESVKGFEQKAGSDLFITISLDEKKVQFVIALYKLTETGAEEIKRYPLSDLENLINKIQFALNNISDEHIEPSVQDTTECNAGTGTEPTAEPADNGAETAGTDATGSAAGAGQSDNG